MIARPPVLEQALICPGLAELCQQQGRMDRQQGRMDRLAEVARQRGDMVHFLAARLQDKVVEKPQGRF